jgi:hypothetical protein
MKKIIFTATLIFVLAAGTAGLTVQDQPAAAPSPSVNNVQGNHITLPPVW